MKNKNMYSRPGQQSAGGTTNLLKYILGGILIFSLGITAGWGIVTWDKSKTVYVKTDQLFEAFALTKSFKAKLENTEQSRVSILEDMELNARTLAYKAEKGINPKQSRDSLEVLVQTIAAKRAQFTEDNQSEAEKYNQQIWTQLNQYIQDYCSEHGYNFVLGTDGKGALMAANPTLDHTDDIIAFANAQFTGK